MNFLLTWATNLRHPSGVEDRMQAKTALHLAALDWAGRGVPVFPCSPGTKRPMPGSSGFKQATCDPSVIDAWWAETPDANVAIFPGGATPELAVIDTDPPTGENAWLALEAEHGATPTYTIRTPRGGFHRYFLGSIPPTTSGLAEHIDTRGVGSYTLVPPSITPDGAYSSASLTPLAVLPAWVTGALGATKRPSIAASPDVKLDTGPNVQRAIQFLRDTAIPAVEWSGGNSRTYGVAAAVQGLGLSRDTTYELMLEHYNPRCSPPWNEDELGVICDHAVAYAQDEAGAHAVASPASTFAPALDKLGVLVAGPQFSYKLWTLAEARGRPPPSWLIPGVLHRNSQAVLYGPPNVGKTWVALDWALAISTGPAAQQVIFYAGEGFEDLVHHRIAAYAAAHPEAGDPMILVSEDMPNFADTETVKAMIREWDEQGAQPSMIVFDTYARAMGGMNENDTRDVNAFVTAAATFKRHWNCTSLILHHSGKNAGLGARGSNALLGAVDTEWELVAHEAVHALEVTCTKMRMGQKPKDALCYETRKVGPGLILQPISVADLRTLTGKNDKLSRDKVAAALAKIGAIGPDEHVTSDALAIELHVHPQEEAPEDTRAQQGRIARALRARASKDLAGYAYGEGPSLLWGLP